MLTSHFDCLITYKLIYLLIYLLVNLSTCIHKLEAASSPLMTWSVADGWPRSTSLEGPVSIVFR